MTSEGWYAGRNEPFTFEELANGSLWEYDHASVSVWVTQTGLVFFFSSFYGGNHKSWGYIGESWEGNVIGVHEVKFPNNQ